MRKVSRIMIKKNRKLIAGIIIVLLVLLYVWNKYFSATHIAVINFRDFQYAQMLDSLDSSFIKIDRLEKTEIADTDLSDYAVTLIFGMGLRLDEHQADHIKFCIKDGAKVYIHSSTNKDDQFTNLTSEQIAQVESYLENGGKKNTARLFNYCRVEFDGKTAFSSEVQGAEIIPMDTLFHLETDAFYSSVEEYEKYYKEKGVFKAGGPKVCLLTSIIGPRSSKRDTINTLIHKLEAKNINVYPVAGFQKWLDFIKDIKPDLAVYFPHGRLNMMGNTDVVIDWFKQQNIPLLCPIDVHEPYDQWLNSQNGMSGGMLSQSIVMPELDGGIEPFAVSAEYPDERGLMVSMPIENRMDTFVSRVDNWLKLKNIPNNEKRVAIFYFKGPGRNSLVASGMEVAESLLNVLRYLKEQGYDTGVLPETVKEFENRIQNEGPVLGPYARGEFERYLEHGQPELIRTRDYLSWVQESLMPEMYQQVEAEYGPAPGNYLSSMVDGQSYIALPRVRFGNIVILPQLMPGIGDDHSKLVHGVKQAPPHPYIAGYLWARKGFKANALIHFGTHGSLEFTPWKQNVLSDMDWADALVGELPHPYVYTINNIGEAIIAKRRSYAAIVSHTTPPYMESELYGPLSELESAVEGYEHVRDEALKAEYLNSIRQGIIELELDKDLELENFAGSELTDERLEKIHVYLHSLAQEKITRGLYVLGRSYEPEQARETAMLMAVESVAHSLSVLDKLKEKSNNGSNPQPAHSEESEVNVYKDKAKLIINEILSGNVSWKEFLPEEDILRLEAWNKDHEKKLHSMRAGRPIKENMENRHSIAAGVENNENQQLIIAKACDPANSTVLFATANDKVLADIVTKWDKETTKQNIEVLGFYANNIELHGEIEQKDGKDNKAVAAILRLGQGHLERAVRVVKQHLQRLEADEKEYIDAVSDLRESLRSVTDYEKGLLDCTEFELAGIANALSGGYIAPSSGGDPLGNPQSVPTGRNLTAINMDKTPTAQSWKVGVKLAEATIQNKLDSTGDYPEKVAITLWGGELIRAEGTQIAMALHFLGVEPVWNSRGIVHDVKLVPMEKLNRPRIDIVVQTSGQARDIAASRLFLINKAVKLASEANDSGEYENFVRLGTLAAEKVMKERGMSPLDAGKFSTARVFGGVNGNYGSNIMGMVESGDRWEDDTELTDLYLTNMGAIYTEDNWGHYQPGIFEAALQNTDTVVHSRSSNNWGPLSLDHVYEFMGGMNAVIRNVTGNEPDAMFSDLRNKYQPGMQDAKKAIWVESRTTLMNPKFITEMQQEGASAADTFAESFRNTYAWNVLKPGAIDKELWEGLYDVYIDDSLNLDMENYFKEKNPYALQEMTAVMLETIRKGYWQADQDIVNKLSQLHVKLITEYKPGCSGFVCDNAKLREMIAGSITPEAAASYLQQIDQVRTAQNQEQVEGMRLEKQDMSLDMIKQTIRENKNTIVLLGMLILILIAVVIFGVKRKKYQMRN